MQLKDYISTVTKVIHYHKTDGEVIDVTLNRDSAQKGETQAEFERAAKEVMKALGNNKKLLGIYDETSETPMPTEVMKERTIEQFAIERHILKTRYDLRQFATEEKSNDKLNILNDNFTGALMRILTELTKEMGIHPDKFGEVFGSNEEISHKKHFEQKPTPTIKSRNQQPDPQSDPPSTDSTGSKPPLPGPNAKTSEEIATIMERLRLEGKIR